MDDIDQQLGRIPEDDWVLTGPGDGETPHFAERVVPDANFPGGVAPAIAAVAADGAGGILITLIAYVKRRRARRRKAALGDD